MADDGKAPDLWELIQKWLYDHFGLLGLAGLAFLLAAFYVWKNWDKVKIWPGISSLIAYLSRHPIPLADPDRFSILVAHLEDDEKNLHERLIVEAIKEFEGIQILTLDRTIPLRGPVPEEMEKKGQEVAQRYLQESGASVLIWGMLLPIHNGTAIKLHWTPMLGEELHSERHTAPRAEDQLLLPEVLWSHLADILRIDVRVSDTKHLLAFFL